MRMSKGYPWMTGSQVITFNYEETEQKIINDLLLALSTHNYVHLDSNAKQLHIKLND